MISLKRVRTCLAHNEPDRVPIDFGGWLSGIKRSAYRRLEEFMGVDGEEWVMYTPPEVILRRFEIDFRRITPVTPSRDAAKNNPDGSITDRWGIERVYENEDDQITVFPLKDATIESLEEYPWPDNNPEGRYEKILTEAQAIHKDGYAVSAQPDVCGVFEQACWLCGFERILMDLALNRDFIHALFEKITVHQEIMANNYYGTVGNNIEMVQTGDDFGTQNGPFFSNDMYRDLIMPYQMRYHAAVKKNTEAMIFQHSCGSVYKLLESMIEAGVEILNPVQVGASEMDPVVLNREFGDRLVFHGGIDVQKALPSMKPSEVKDEVKRILDALAPGGGYILAPSHNIQGDTPPENIVTMFETALEYGNY